MGVYLSRHGMENNTKHKKVTQVRTKHRFGIFQSTFRLLSAGRKTSATAQTTIIKVVLYRCWVPAGSKGHKLKRAKKPKRPKGPKGQRGQEAKGPKGPKGPGPKGPKRPKGLRGQRAQGNGQRAIMCHFLYIFINIKCHLLQMFITVICFPSSVHDWSMLFHKLVD